MLKLTNFRLIGLASCVALALAACGDETKPTPVKIKPIAVLSPAGVGPINATTPFNLHQITEAFQGLSVTERTNFAEGEKYPVINVSQGIKTLMTINPDTKREKIFSVVVLDNAVSNQLGHKIGTKFTDIYPYGKIEECAAGMADMQGKVLCYAPKQGNILYLFNGIWNGPANTVPPLETLGGWQLAGMVWKPPAKTTP